MAFLDILMFDSLDNKDKWDNRSQVEFSRMYMNFHIHCRNRGKKGLF